VVVVGFPKTGKLAENTEPGMRDRGYGIRDGKQETECRGEGRGEFEGDLNSGFAIWVDL
jgi:hypothetical protein